jgi:hypothetical protein
MRVYHDRLVNSTDKQLLINSAALIARSLLSQTDKKEVEPVQKKEEDGKAEEKKEKKEKEEEEEEEKEEKKGDDLQSRRVVFADFMHGREGENRPYA